VSRAFRAGGFGFIETLGRCPRLEMNVAPLALKHVRTKSPLAAQTQSLCSEHGYRFS
jgi:hypothetical protein